MKSQQQILEKLLELADCPRKFTKFGKLIDVDRSVVSKYVNGVHAITLDTFMQWCKKSNIDPKYCF